MSSNDLAKGYEPHQVEARWYRYWEEGGLFAAGDTPGRDPYCIVIPPPNVTGVLHMGHALNNTLQDILIRYHRMRGLNTLWQPGTDHAGIATQNVVEKALAEEGTDRHAVGRDKFIERVWQWRREKGGQIINQLKRLGCSCDWSRERFTMDDGLSRAVREVFVKLYEEGLIFRGDYIINWCPRCHTALADLEVEHEDVDGHLYHIRYPLADGSGHLTIATTRPETMLGDTAVSVNPEDKRYQKYIGAQVVLPLLGRRMPVIGDAYVTTDFGTGVLKVTPAHDLNDFEIGRRHDLDTVIMMDESAAVTEAGEKYAGLDRFEARQAVIADLESQGLLAKIEPYRHAVGHCYRCQTMIEPLLSKQWFVRAEPLAKKAIEGVQSGRTKIFPENWTKTYFEWLENIRDWCISRQIWWGHRIPAWTCTTCGEVIVSRTDPDKCPCGGELQQETDVLDTWFSSALWPFSTLGWPDETPELARYYPTSVLVTGFDILFFWVARMMMMGLHFKGDVPFRHVYLHALVRTETGEKMSKSKGTAIDPLEVMDKYGTDAFRFTLAAFAAMGRDIRMSEERIAGYRNFMNKLWNAARLTLLNVEPEADGPAELPRDLPVEEAWIISRLGAVTAEVRLALDEYRFNDAAQTLYQFTWHEFCDWYLELAKPALYGDDPGAKRVTQAVLTRVLSALVRLLHPFIPFITEEIHQKLVPDGGSIMVAPYPQADEFPRDEAAEARVARLIETVTSIRNIRGEMNVPPGAMIEVVLACSDPDAAATLTAFEHHLVNLARAESVRVAVGAPESLRPAGSAAGVAGDVSVFVPLAGLVDFAAEEARLGKEITKIDKDLSRVQAKLGNDDFLHKAPAEVVQKEKDKAAALSGKLAKLTDSLARVQQYLQG